MPTVSLTDKGAHLVETVSRETLADSRYMQETRELLGDLYDTGALEVDQADDIPISRDTFMYLLKNRYIEIN